MKRNVILVHDLISGNGQKDKKRHVAIIVIIFIIAVRIWDVLFGFYYLFELTDADEKKKGKNEKSKKEHLPTYSFVRKCLLLLKLLAYIYF
jgi:flagellar basal body-associated protein FliL